MKYFNDEFTLNIEQLGYQQQVETIRTLIIESKTPFSVGISGRWGSGKTSIMKYLMASLDGEPLKYQLNFEDDAEELAGRFKKIADKYKQKNQMPGGIHTIWFNPWENENHKEPMVALLQEIYNHFSLYADSLKKSKKILSVTLQSGLDMLGSIGKLGKNQGSNIVDIGEKYESENFQYFDRNQKLKYIFQDAIKTLLIQTKLGRLKEPHQKAKIVIFIDDLDRCEDDTIAKLLKEIKQYLATKHCVFVFGYDRQHIEKSLAKSESKTHKETRAYLEKLLQTTFYIKEPEEKELKSFISEIVNEYKFVDNDELTDLVQFLIDIIDPNPRRLKAFLTAYYFHILNSEFYQLENNVQIKSIALEDLQKLALIAYLKLFYESVYTALENKHDMLKAIVNVCGHKDKNQLENAQEYFIYLELLSHIHDTVVTDFTDGERKKVITESNLEAEQKFLNEVYQMQGKHKSFEAYQKHFAQLFVTETEIANYL